MPITGSGIIPIINDSNNNFYIVLFKSIRSKNKLKGDLLEDAGGKYEGDNIKMSAIRELKEESSMIFNLENLTTMFDIRKLNKILNEFNIKINNDYISYFVYLGVFNLDNLRTDYKANLRNFWKNK